MRAPSTVSSAPYTAAWARISIEPISACADVATRNPCVIERRAADGIRGVQRLHGIDVVEQHPVGGATMLDRRSQGAVDARRAARLDGEPRRHQQATRGVALPTLRLQRGGHLDEVGRERRRLVASTAGAGLQRQGTGGDGPRGAALFGESPGGVVGGGGGPGRVAVGELDLGRREQCSRQLGGLTLLVVHRHAGLHQGIGVLEQPGVGEGLGVIGVQPRQHRVGVGPPVHRLGPRELVECTGQVTAQGGHEPEVGPRRAGDEVEPLALGELRGRAAARARRPSGRRAAPARRRGCRGSAPRRPRRRRRRARRRCGAGGSPRSPDRPSSTGRCRAGPRCGPARFRSRRARRRADRAIEPSRSPRWATAKARLDVIRAASSRSPPCARRGHPVSQSGTGVLETAGLAIAESDHPVQPRAGQDVVAGRTRRAARRARSTAPCGSTSTSPRRRSASVTRASPTPRTVVVTGIIVTAGCPTDHNGPMASKRTRPRPGDEPSRPQGGRPAVGGRRARRHPP